eukprot:11374688-Prorocentrum_lima.AAC.1
MEGGHDLDVGAGKSRGGGGVLEVGMGGSRGGATGGSRERAGRWDGMGPMARFPLVQCSAECCALCRACEWD